MVGYQIEEIPGNPTHFRFQPQLPRRFVALQVEQIVGGGGILICFAEEADQSIQYLVKWDGSAWSLVASGTDLFLGGDATLAYQPFGFPMNQEAVKLGGNHYLCYDSALMRSADGGQTWTNVLAMTVTESLSGIPVCIDANGDLYAVIFLFTASGNSEIWKSTDNGATFSLVSTEADSNHILTSIAADPNDASVVIASGNFRVLGVDHGWLRGLSSSFELIQDDIVSEPDVQGISGKTIITDTGRMVWVTYSTAPGFDYLRVFYTDSPPASGWTFVDVVTVADPPGTYYVTEVLLGGIVGNSTALFFVYGKTGDTTSHVAFSSNNAASWVTLTDPGMFLSGIHYDEPNDILYAVEGYVSFWTGGQTVKRMLSASGGAGVWEDITAGMVSAMGATNPLAFMQMAIMAA